jgi:hypothetical protein
VQVHDHDGIQVVSLPGPALNLTVSDSTRNHVPLSIRRRSRPRAGHVYCVHCNGASRVPVMVTVAVGRGHGPGPGRHGDGDSRRRLARRANYY